MHEYLSIALSIVGGVFSIVVSIAGGLVLRLLHKLDALETAKEKHAIELRDTRSAIAFIQGKLNQTPFPYTNE